MKKSFILAVVISCATTVSAQSFKLNESGYFESEGVNVMSFDDFYPEGHQGGVSILMNGNRIATNGDLRFEPTPGQWQPVPERFAGKVGFNLEFFPGFLFGKPWIMDGATGIFPQQPNGPVATAK